MRLPDETDRMTEIDGLLRQCSLIALRAVLTAREDESHAALREHIAAARESLRLAVVEADQLRRKPMGE